MVKNVRNIFITSLENKDNLSKQRIKNRKKFLLNKTFNLNTTFEYSQKLIW